MFPEEQDLSSLLPQDEASVASLAFFETLLREITLKVGAKYALLSEIDPRHPDQLKPLVSYLDGEFKVTPSYHISGTPCEKVIENGFFLVEEGVQDRFPEDLDLVCLRAIVYVGIAIEDENGAPIGVLCVLHDDFLDLPADLSDILSLSSRRASAEVLRLRAARQLHKSTELAKAAEEAKSEFLATVSHELLTPLNAILGFSDILQTQKFGELNEHQQKFLHNVTAGGRRLHQLIRDILDLARIEMGGMKLNITRFDSLESIQQMVDSMKPLAQEKDILMEFSIDSSPLLIIADKEKFDKILRCLLSNAIKFTPREGHVSVQAKQETKASPNDVSASKILRVSILDTGIGVPPEHHEGIFRIFKQLDSSYSREYPGIGVGLALSKGLALLHGGKMWVESEGEGRGSAFHFTIPFEPLEEYRPMKT